VVTLLIIFAIIIAMAQIVQVQVAAWYVKLTDWIFGKVIPSAQTLYVFRSRLMCSVRDILQVILCQQYRLSILFRYQFKIKMISVSSFNAW